MHSTACPYAPCRFNADTQREGIGFKKKERYLGVSVLRRRRVGQLIIVTAWIGEQDKAAQNTMELAALGI